MKTDPDAQGQHENFALGEGWTMMIKWAKSQRETLGISSPSRFTNFFPLFSTQGQWLRNDFWIEGSGFHSNCIKIYGSGRKCNLQQCKDFTTFKLKDVQKRCKILFLTATAGLWPVVGDDWCVRGPEEPPHSHVCLILPLVTVESEVWQSIPPLWDSSRYTPFHSLSLSLVDLSLQ